MASLLARRRIRTPEPQRLQVLWQQQVYMVRLSMCRRLLDTRPYLLTPERLQ